MSTKQTLGTITALALLLSSISACSATSTPDDSSGGNPPIGVAKPLLIAVPGVSVREISLYQGIKRQIMVDGAPVETGVPIVSGRDALFRVFVDVTSEYAPGTTVTARLYFEGVDEPFESQVFWAGPASSDEKLLDSTINIKVPGDVIKPDAKYRLELGEVGEFPPSSVPLFYPPNKELAPLAADPTDATLKIRLVPVQYKADGSGRLPNTSPERVQEFIAAFRAMYPIANIEIDVRDPLPWSQAASANGTGWDVLLDRVATVRQQDGVPLNVYYYGIFNPADSLSQYCAGGCVAGLGYTSSAKDSFAKAAIGLGYEGYNNIASETALHEVGHNHGRFHAPCQTGDPDTKYPYAGGKTGVWGYDERLEKLFAPTTADIMGYCTPVWISDYTYNALFDRIKAVNASARMVVPEALQNRAYTRLMVDGTGNAKWLPTLKLAIPPDTEVRKIVVESDSGDLEIEGYFYAFDHLEGGTLVFPEPEKSFSAVRFSAVGKAIRLLK